jgi:transcriptional regulator with XRE-family HTH domain
VRTHRAGKPQRIVAELAGITGPYLCLIEKGKTEIRIGLLEALAEALQVNISDLL